MNLKVSKRLYDNFAETLASRRIQERECELQQSHLQFGSIRDQVSNALDDVDEEYDKGVEDLEANIYLFGLLERLRMFREDRVKCLRRTQL